MKENKNEYTGSTTLSIRVAGPEMDKNRGYDLDAVISALQDSQTLIRKTYLATQGRARFTEKDFDNFQVRLMEWRPGSLWSDLSLNFQNVVLPVLPFVADNREFIWESIKSSYTLIKAKLRAKSEGKEVTVKQETGEYGINVNNSGPGTVIVAPIGLPDIADKVQPYIEQLAQNLDGKRVDRIKVQKNADSTDESDSFTIDMDDKRLLSTVPTLTSDDINSVSGKITSGNFDTNTGKIEVTSSSVEAIKPGKSYRVRIDADLHAEDKWKQMFLTDRPYYCKYSVSSRNPNTVVEITIVDWDESEWDEVV
jgi:hypothetical protein